MKEIHDRFLLFVEMTNYQLIWLNSYFNIKIIFKFERKTSYFINIVEKLRFLFIFLFLLEN